MSISASADPASREARSPPASGPGCSSVTSLGRTEREPPSTSISMRSFRVFLTLAGRFLYSTRASSAGLSAGGLTSGMGRVRPEVNLRDANSKRSQLPKMPTVLGIDQGTSSVKVVLIDESGRELGKQSAGYPLLKPRPGWVEQDPEDWWRAACSAVQALLAETGTDPGDVAGVALSGQINGAVVADASGACLRNSLIWLDHRSAEECRWAEERAGDLLRDRAFSRVTPVNFLAKLLWLHRHEADLLSRGCLHPAAEGLAAPAPDRRGLQRNLRRLGNRGLRPAAPAMVRGGFSIFSTSTRECFRPRSSPPRSSVPSRRGPPRRSACAPAPRSAPGEGTFPAWCLAAASSGPVPRGWGSEPRPTR